MIDVSLNTDWDFVVALSATAGVIAIAILGYALMVHRRARAREGQAARDARTPASEADHEAIFFKRYVPPDE